MKGKSKKAKVVEKPITKEDIKSYSLDEVKDEIIGEKGSPDREDYEATLAENIKKDQAKQTKKAKINDTKTDGRVSEEATSAPDKKYGDELAKALEHITRGKTMQVDLKKSHPDELQKGVETLVIASDASEAIPELRNLGYVLSQSDTKYLRIAVRYAKDQTLKNTLLVFHLSK